MLIRTLLSRLGIVIYIEKMKKIQEFIYTIATILIVMGALFILQEEVYGLILLVGGISINVVYRIFNLNVDKLKNINIIEILRSINIIFLLFTLLMFFMDNNQRFNLLIVAIVFDFLVNIKELSFKKK